MSRWASCSASAASCPQRRASARACVRGRPRRSGRASGAEVETQTLRLGEAGPGIGTDPASVAGDDAARHAELAVGVVDRVADVRFGRYGAAARLTGLRDRGVECGVRRTQARQFA
jgi:hypothetical protein